MTIESALYSYLSGKAEVNAEIATRIYPQIGPPGAVYPFLTYMVLGEDHTHDMGGASGLVNVSMQIDVWALTQKKRSEIAEVLRNVLDGFAGDMGAENLNIRQCFLESRSNFQEPETEGREKPVFRTSLDFSIWHVESSPTL